MLRWQIGNVTVSAVVETTWPLPISWMMPDATPDVIASMPWLGGDWLDDEGRMTIAVHAFVVESQGRRIVVDTCAGNGKRRDGVVAALGDLETDFPDRMAQAGFGFDTIDTVVCTHLHFDHVGWNTVSAGDEWVPAFPEAQYLFDGRDVAHWSTHPEEMHAAAYDDSVAPILDAGKAVLVSPEHAITDEVRLVATPGHSPGHMSVWIASQGREAVITGDAIHHPVQLVQPEWRDITDTDTVAAARTRAALAARAERDGALVLGTHFPAPTAGNVVVRNGASVFTPAH